MSLRHSFLTFLAPWRTLLGVHNAWILFYLIMENFKYIQTQDNCDEPLLPHAWLLLLSGCYHTCLIHSLFSLFYLKYFKANLSHPFIWPQILQYAPLKIWLSNFNSASFLPFFSNTEAQVSKSFEGKTFTELAIVTQFNFTVKK